MRRSRRLRVEELHREIKQANGWGTKAVSHVSSTPTGKRTHHESEQYGEPEGGVMDAMEQSRVGLSNDVAARGIPFWGKEMGMAPA